MEKEVATILTHWQNFGCTGKNYEVLDTWVKFCMYKKLHFYGTEGGKILDAQKGFFLWNSRWQNFGITFFVLMEQEVAQFWMHKKVN